MNLFGRLASVINKLPWVVVGAGIIFASVAGIFGGSVSQSLQSGGFEDPSSQSSQAVARAMQELDNKMREHAAEQAAKAADTSKVN